MSEYPWESIPSNPKPGQFAVRSTDVDGAYPWLDTSWGRTPAGNAALIIGYKKSEWKPDPLPQFASIRVQESKQDCVLAIELVDAAAIDMFYKICLDLIEAAREANSGQIRATTLFRLERWSSLLARRSKLLSVEEQKGLIAELLTLRDCIFPSVGIASALQGWTGPNNETQDFNYGQIAIEVKAKRKASQPFVHISSETQLAVGPNEQLYLRVVELNQEVSGKGFTLNSVVREVKGAISSPLHQSHFDSLLASIGYFDIDNYEAFAWSLGSIRVYEVTMDFPRITKDSIDFGVDKVSYRLDLDYCSDFESNDETLLVALRSDNDKS